MHNTITTAGVKANMYKKLLLLPLVFLLVAASALAISVDFSELNNSNNFYTYNFTADLHDSDVIRMDNIAVQIINTKQNLTSSCLYEINGTYNASSSSEAESSICSAISIISTRNNATLNNTNGTAYGYGYNVNNTFSYSNVSWNASPTYIYNTSFGSATLNASVTGGEYNTLFTFNASQNTQPGAAYILRAGLAGFENASQKFTYTANTSVDEITLYEFTLDKTLTTVQNPLNQTVTFEMNITNNASFNYTLLRLEDHYDAAFLNYSNASIQPTNVNLNTGEINWTLNFTANESKFIQINFTTLQTGLTTNNASLYNMTESIANTSAQINITEPLTTITKTANAQSFNETDYVTFTINATNNNYSTINLTIKDVYTPSELTFTNASLNYTTINQTNGTITWNVTLSQSQSTSFTITFQINTTGNITNQITLNNISEQLTVNASTISASALPTPFNRDDTFNYTGKALFANATVPSFINATILVKDYTNTSQTPRAYHTTTISANGTFVLEDVFINSTAGEKGLLKVTTYTDGTRTQESGISPLFFEADAYHFTQIMDLQNVYLSPATRLNLTAITQNGSVNFTYSIVDGIYGFPITSSQKEGLSPANDAQIVLNANKSYYVHMQTIRGPLSTFHLPKANMSANKEQTYNYQANLTFNIPNIQGYLHYPNGSIIQNMDEMNVFAIEMFAQNHISLDLLHPQNLCANTNLQTECSAGAHSDTNNLSTGFFNITTAITPQGAELVWIAFAKVGTTNYMGYIPLNVSYNDTLLYQNITLTAMYGQDANITLDNTIQGLNETITSQYNISTKTKYLAVWAQANYNTSFNATIDDLHVQIELFRNNLTHKWIMDDLITNQVAQFFLPDNTTLGYAHTFTREFAPKETTLTLTNANQTQELQGFDIYSFDSSLDPIQNNSNSIQASVYKTTSDCNALFVANASACTYKAATGSDTFNPVSLLVDELIHLIIQTDNVSLHFFNTDVSSAGPVDAIIDNTRATIRSDEDVWQFGSFAPQTYDYVYAVVPISSSYNASEDNFTVSINALFDQDWITVWNRSSSGTEANLPANYRDFLGEYTVYFNGSKETCMRTNSTNLTGVAPSQLCYIIEDQDKLAFKILHFSGVAAQIDVNGGYVAPTNNNNNNDDDDSSSGGSSGGGGGSSSAAAATSLEEETDLHEKKIFRFLKANESVLFNHTIKSLPLQEVEFTPYEKITKLTLTIYQREEIAISWNNQLLEDPYERAYAYLEIKEKENVLINRSDGKAKIFFTINSSWLEDEDVLLENVLFNVRENDTWEKYIPTYLYTKAGVEYFEVEVDSMLTTHAITALGEWPRAGSGASGPRVKGEAKIDPVPLQNITTQDETNETAQDEFTEAEDEDTSLIVYIIGAILATTVFVGIILYVFHIRKIHHEHEANEVFNKEYSKPKKSAGISYSFTENKGKPKKTKDKASKKK